MLELLAVIICAVLFVEFVQLPGHGHDHERHHKPHDDLEQVREALAMNEESA